MGGWERAARLALQLLPGWMVRLHYNSSVFYPADVLNQSSESSAVPSQHLCWLRTLKNVELVDMYGAALPAEWWPYAPALEGDAVAAVFVVSVTPGNRAGPGGSSVEMESRADSTDAGGAVLDGILDAGSMERIAEWQACGAQVLKPQRCVKCDSGSGATSAGDDDASLAPGGCDSGAGGLHFVWGVRGGSTGLGAVRAAVLRAVKQPDGTDAKGLRRGLLVGLDADDSEAH